jgi:hypothetical protein
MVAYLDARLRFRRISTALSRLPARDQEVLGAYYGYEPSEHPLGALAEVASLTETARGRNRARAVRGMHAPIEATVSWLAAATAPGARDTRVHMVTPCVMRLSDVHKQDRHRDERWRTRSFKPRPPAAGRCPVGGEHASASKSFTYDWWPGAPEHVPCHTGALRECAHSRPLRRADIRDVERCTRGRSSASRKLSARRNRWRRAGGALERVGAFERRFDRRHRAILASAVVAKTRRECVSARQARVHRRAQCAMACSRRASTRKASRATPVGGEWDAAPS